MKKILLFLILAFIQNLFFAQTTYYVKTDGSNSNNGLSWGAAKTTIQAAHDAANAGDVILVKYGTYTLSTHISISKNVKITSDDGNGTGWNDADYDCNQCIFNGSSSSSYSIIRMTDNSITNNCIIRGLQFTGIVATDFATDALYVQNGSPIVEYCKFFNNGSRGIRCDNSSMIARNNIFDDNDDCGMYTYQGSGTVKFYNNLIINSHDGFASDDSDVNLYNNTIAHCSEALKIGDASTINIFNSILVYNEYAIYNYASENNTVSFTNCRIWSNTTGIGGDGISSQTNTTTTNPSFVGTGDNPYSLQNISDCVNSGSGLTTNEIGNKDILGATRFYNSIEDLGAYELQADCLITITNKSPEDGTKTPNMSLSDITFSFNRDVTARGGNITLYSEGGTVVKQLASTNSDVVVDGRNITMHVNVTLTSGTRYYVNISPTAFDEGHGFYFEGISNDTDWDWISDSPDPYPGNALDFDGTNDYVNIPDDNALDLTDNYTLEAWICPRSFSSMAGIWSKHQSNNNSGGIELCLSSEEPYRGIYYDGAITAPDILTANTWYHIAIVRNNDSKRIYINGEEVATHGMWFGNVTNSTPVTIGSDRGGRYFNGLIDEIRIWNAARSVQQIRENMHITSTGTEFRLQGYWQFNETSGSVLYDRKNGRNGTLNNMSDNDWSESPIPIGSGSTNTQSISNGFTGSVIFTGTDFSMNVNSKTGADSYTASKIEYTPNVNPSDVIRTYDQQYWVLHKYGSGSWNANLTFTLSEVITQDEENNLASITLFRRDYNAAGNWIVVSSAFSYNVSENSFTFNNVSTDGQFIIARRAGMSVATVETNSITNVGTTSATSGGNITSDDVSVVTARGVCWSTSSNPTTADSHTSDGTGTGSFTSSITDLTVNTKYYARAYAINSVGTSYGNEINFITYPGSGSGTPSDPYLISSLDNLSTISTNNVYWDKNFKQTADIDASATSTWNSDGSGGYYGWSPIGDVATPFTGSYNGNGHTIDHLNINNRGSNCGFFGNISGASVSNLGLSQISINNGASYIVGGIAGTSQNSSQISNCYVSGSISSGGISGGIVGQNNSSTISNSYSSASISSDDRSLGGIVGSSSGTITNCYSTGLLSGSGSPKGGLVGSNSGTMTNSFWDTQTSLQSSSAGQGSTSGGTGETTELMKTQSTFTNASWDFVGESTNGTNDYWRIGTSSDNDGYPLLSWQKCLATVTTQNPTNINSTTATGNGNITELGNPNPTQHGVCWNTIGTPTTADSKTLDGTISSTGAFTSNITGLIANTKYYVRAYATNSTGTSYGSEVSFRTYPGAGSGTSGDPYQVSSLECLIYICQTSDLWNKYFIQTVDIDASQTQYWDDAEDNGDGNLYNDPNDLTSTGNNEGWSPIGNSTTKFTGTYNGQGYTINNLYITRGTTDYIGFFGYTLGGVISNLNLTGVNIHGQNIVGGFVGWNENTNLTNCSSTGTVSGAAGVGGLAGWVVNSTFDKCYSTVSVSSTGHFFGGVASRFEGTTISNCYATGSVSGPTKNYGGGFAGSSISTAIDKCYSTGAVTGGGDDIGGFVGHSDNPTIITNSFWDTQTSLQALSPDGGIEKTTELMKTQSTFTDAGWSISIWNMGDGINNGYPYLNWQNPGGTPLPVELTSFIISANGNRVTLTWQTATEINNYGFEVERKSISSRPSVDIWTKIGFIQGNRNSNSPKSYSFTDLLNSGTKFLYRLKQLDNDGKFEYSNSIEVVLESPASFALNQNYPNPFNPTTTIEISIPVAGKYTVKIYDMLGQEVASLIDRELNAGIHKATFDAHKLVSGIYIYKLIGNNVNLTKKMILIK